MSDTVIRLIERRSVGDKYILVSINILTFLFSNTPFLYFCSVQIGGMVATCVFMFVVLHYFTWLLTWPSSTTALWFTNICLKTIPDMESWGECVWKYTPNFECYILNSEGNLPQVFLIPLFGTYPSIKLCCSDLCGLGKFIQSQYVYKGTFSLVSDVTQKCAPKVIWYLHQWCALAFTGSNQQYSLLVLKKPFLLFSTL